MPSRFVTPLRCSLLIAILITPAVGSAQEATLTSTVADSTGGVLPGVTVTAIHESTGNRFETVTDERGIYRIPARVGAYQLTAELSGFSTVARLGIQLLVGQTAASAAAARPDHRPAQRLHPAATAAGGSPPAAARPARRARVD